MVKKEEAAEGTAAPRLCPSRLLKNTCYAGGTQGQDGGTPDELDAAERDGEICRIVKRENGHVAYTEALPETNGNGDSVDQVEKNNIVKERHPPDLNQDPGCDR